jgi:hypothetical protein
MLQQPRSQEETPCTRTQEVSWEIILNKRRKPSQNPLIYSSRERPSPPIGPRTQEGAQTLEE